jgi:hypothetical protein
MARFHRTHADEHPQIRYMCFLKEVWPDTVATVSRPVPSLREKIENRRPDANILLCKVARAPVLQTSEKEPVQVAEACAVSCRVRLCVGQDQICPVQRAPRGGAESDFAHHFCLQNWGRIVRTTGFRNLNPASVIELCAEASTESRVVGGEDLDLLVGPPLWPRVWRRKCKKTQRK